MLKILIADDEKYIRESISSLIDWKSLDLELIGVAADGIEAYNIILDRYPDIVLTDIRMPGLSGLDLIEKIHQVNKDTQFIILSGFNEFDYAKKAMQYGVRHYLLKPCSEKEIIQSILEMKEAYAHRLVTQSIIDEHSALQKQIDMNLTVNLLHHYLASDEEILLHSADEKFPDYSRHFESRNQKYELYYFYFIEENNYEEALRMLSSFWLQNFSGIPLHSLYVRNTLVVFFPSFAENYQLLEDYCLHLKFQVQHTLPQLKHLVFSSLAQVLKKITCQIRRYDKIIYSNGSNRIVIGNYNNMQKSIQHSANCLFRAKQESSDEILQSLKDSVANISDFTFLKQLASTIVMTAASGTSAFGIVDAAELLIHLEDLSDIEEYRTCLLDKIQELYNAGQSLSANLISNRIKDYVLSNIGNSELSLKWIAENKLYMNVDYLSKKFVKETGQKFSTFLTETRIKKAKELLSSASYDTTLNMSDIAQSVGCGNNPQYFSQIFKKVTGLSPSSYVKALRNQSMV